MHELGYVRNENVPIVAALFDNRIADLWTPERTARFLCISIKTLDRIELEPRYVGHRRKYCPVEVVAYTKRRRNHEQRKTKTKVQRGQTLYKV